MITFYETQIEANAAKRADRAANRAASKKVRYAPFCSILYWPWLVSQSAKSPETVPDSDGESALDGLDLDLSDFEVFRDPVPG